MPADDVDPAAMSAASASIVADLRAMFAQVAALPPAPREIRASHLVPYGRAYRQWLTDGSLIVWVNRGEIADLPHAKAYGIEVALSTLAPPWLFGIPVVNA